MAPRFDIGPTNARIDRSRLRRGDCCVDGGAEKMGAAAKALPAWDFLPSGGRPTTRYLPRPQAREADPAGRAKGRGAWPADTCEKRWLSARFRRAA
jgi:hypothetical protein